MGELEFPKNIHGEIERFGATQKITDQLTLNFHKRGQDAAGIVLATLTESPYTPDIDGQRFGVEVSNVYNQTGSPEDAAEDTVETARQALREFVFTGIPGSRPLLLATRITKYGRIFDKLAPSLLTPRIQRESFDDALVERCRLLGIEVASPSQAREIVARAPIHISFLNLDASRSRTQLTKAVTSHGRIIQVENNESLWADGRYHVSLPDDANERGGTAPGSTIGSQIERVVVKRRTKHSER